MSPESRARLQRISWILMLMVALLGWWLVVEEGASPARVIGAVAATAAAVLQALVPGRRRLLGRRPGAGQEP